MKFLRNMLSRVRLRRWRARDIPGCLTVLPVLRAQVGEIADHLEQAVTGVCGNFSGIAARARKTVDQGAELLRGGRQEPNATVEQSIESSRATIGALLARLEHAGRLSSLVVERMEQVEGAVAGIESLLAELQRIAFSNKLVALNAKIEAVHVGQAGSGFEVVADEITRQADRSNQLAEGIGDRVRGMRDRVSSAAGELRVFVAEDRAGLAESHSQADAALDLLLSVHRHSSESLALIASENAQLAHDISDAVVGLQFQDRVCQRLSHIAEALEKMERNLGGHTPPRSAISVMPSDQSLLENVRQGYTMESERAVLARTLQEPECAASGGDVELF